MLGPKRWWRVCKERRATFQKTDMAENGTVYPVFSVNLTRAQAIFSIAASVAVLLGGIFSGMLWARSSIVEIASADFQKAMDAYYASVIPERNLYYQKLLDQELLRFEIETSKPIEARLDSLNTRVTTLETQGENVVKILDRHEGLLLEILRRLPE